MTAVEHGAAPGDEPGALPRQGGGSPDLPRLAGDGTAAVVRVVGYDRVSTLAQADGGAGMDVQRDQIRKVCELRGWELVELVEDPARSGKSMRRPGMDRALRMLARGEVSALVATKVDRVSRSVADFADLLARAGREGWDLVILELGLDTSTAHGRFAAHMMAAVAELEREMISSRTREALAVRRAQGVRLGRRSTLPADVVARVDGLRRSGLSLQKVADVLNGEGVVTGQGAARWQPSTVRAVLNRVTS